MRHGNMAASVDDQRDGYGTAVQVGDIFGPSKHSMIDFFSSDVGPDGIPTIIVESDTEDNEITLFISLLKLIKPGDLDVTRDALGIP